MNRQPISRLWLSPVWLARMVLAALLFSFLQLSDVGIIAGQPDTERYLYRVSIKGAITPATMGRLRRAIDKANSKAKELHVRGNTDPSAVALLVTLDTPGGLMASMDEMIRDILNASVPVITYVSPPGATCGSAGVYILMASHVAAMAPATNIGSATPVQMSPGAQDKPASGDKTDRIPEEAGADDALNMKRKLLHHAVAQIRGLAEFHGRNASFAERTITRAENVTSTEALRLNAIDVIALSEAELLQKIEGRKIRMINGTVTLSLQNATVVNVEDDFRDRLLLLITDPNLAYILMMIGIVGILAEIQYPGSIFPGVIGSICLILGLYAMQTLPVNWAGFGLILLGFLFFLLEVKIMSYGLLGIAGAISILLGSVLMAKSADELTSVSLITVLTTSIMAILASFILSYKAVQAMRRSPVIGEEALLQETGKVIQDISEKGGRVFIHGEYWNARSEDGRSIAAGSTIRPVRREGMLLFVKAVNEENSRSQNT
jgi:membrane-bound serine protease (ClpP class)